MSSDAERRLSMALMIIGIIVVMVSTFMIFYELIYLNAKYADCRHADPADRSSGMEASDPAGDDGAAADASSGETDGEEAASSGFEPAHPEFNAVTGILEGGEQRSSLEARTEIPVTVNSPVNVSSPVTINVPESLFAANRPAPPPIIYTNATTASTCNHDGCCLSTCGCAEAAKSGRAVTIKDVTLNVSPIIILQMNGGSAAAPAPQETGVKLSEAEQPEDSNPISPEEDPAVLEAEENPIKATYPLKERLQHGLTFALGAGISVTDYADYGSWHGYDPLSPELTAGYFVRMAAGPCVWVGLEAYGIYSPHLYSANTSNTLGTAAGGSHWDEMSLSSLNHIVGAGARLEVAFAVGKGYEAYVFGGVETSVPVRKAQDDPSRKVNTGIWALAGGFGLGASLGSGMSIGIEGMYMHTPGYRGSVGVRIGMHYPMSGV